MYAASFLATLLLLPALPVLAYEIDGNNYCEGPFALCASGTCQTIAGDSSHLHCTCDIYNGLNVGTSSCAARVNSLISTYSIINRFPSSSQPPLYSFPCTGANAGVYGSCYGAPCTNNGNGTATCTCPTATGPNHYLGTTCPSSAAQTEALCKQLRVSGPSTTAPLAGSATATGAAATSTAQILAQFYGTTVPMEKCNAPGS